jgi:hypothetical protein
LIADGIGLVALSYRGHMGSTGCPTERGLLRDAEAAIRRIALSTGSHRASLAEVRAGSEITPERPTPWLRVQFYRTGLCPKFPASRESAGNFCRFRLPRAILTQIRHANSMAYTKIPYAAEQGIFAG